MNKSPAALSYCKFRSAIGPVLLLWDDNGICGVYTGMNFELPAGSIKRDRDPFGAVAQLTEYFSGRRRAFDIRLHASGTPFQRRVWNALSKIPYGTAVSYGDIAREIGCPRGARAVGMACARNPLSIIVPCHRVIGSDATMTGFSGGLGVKEKLLRLEHARFRNAGLKC